MIKHKRKKINIGIIKSRVAFNSFDKVKNRAMRLFLYGLVGIFVSYSLFDASNVFFLSNAYAAQELIDQAFMPAREQDTIINLGTTKDAVGNEVFREGASIQNAAGIGCFVNGQRLTSKELDTKATAMGYTIVEKDNKENTYRNFCESVLGGDWDVSAITTQAPLIVRITKFLLRMTIVLSITMVLYSGVMYIVESSKGAEVKETTNNLMYIIGGVLLALMSLGILNLIGSIGMNTLNTSTFAGDKCVINGKTLVGDEIKQYVCENSFNGSWYDDRVGDRCRVDAQLDGGFNGGHWAPITDGEKVSKCTELGGEYTSSK